MLILYNNIKGFNNKRGEVMTTYHDYWDHNEIQVINFLNSIPDTDFTMLVQGVNLRSIVVALENAFGLDYQEAYPEDSESMFAWLSDNEIMEYLSNRFGVEFEEETCFVLSSFKEEINRDTHAES